MPSRKFICSSIQIEIKGQAILFETVCTPNCRINEKLAFAILDGRGAHSNGQVGAAGCTAVVIGGGGKSGTL